MGNLSSTDDDVIAGMRDKVIEDAELTGTFAKMGQKAA
jgi:hypothetical protein